MKKLRVILLACVILVSFCAGALAVGNLEEIKAFLNYGITVKLDGEEQIMYDGVGNRVYPITYNGTTYVPIRAVSNMLDIDVNWDGATNTVLLGEVPQEVPAKPEGTISRGVVSGNNYKNDYLGIDVTVPADWGFATDEEIAATFNITEELFDMELEKALEENGGFCDVFASDDAGKNFNIILEKKNELAKTLSKEQLQEAYRASFQQVKELYDDCTITETTFNIGGKETFGFNVSGKLYGQELYQSAFMIDCGDYLANVTVTGYTGNDTKEIISWFE